MQLRQPPQRWSRGIERTQSGMSGLPDDLHLVIIKGDQPDLPGLPVYNHAVVPGRAQHGANILTPGGSEHLVDPFERRDSVFRDKRSKQSNGHPYTNFTEVGPEGGRRVEALSPSCVQLRALHADALCEDTPCALR